MLIKPLGSFKIYIKNFIIYLTLSPTTTCFSHSYALYSILIHLECLSLIFHLENAIVLTRISQLPLADLITPWPPSRLCMFLTSVRMYYGDKLYVAQFLLSHWDLPKIQTVEPCVLRSYQSMAHSQYSVNVNLT